MEFDQLSTLLTIAKTGSFSAAAKQLFKTQPAISQSIKNLETEIGEALLIRGGRQVRLTHAGQILVQHAASVGHTLQRAKDQIAELGDLSKGRLSISTNDTIASYILPEIIRKYRSKYPGIDIEILNNLSLASIEELRSQRSDLAVMALPIKGDQLVAEKIRNFEDMALCSKHHPLAKRDRITLKALSEYPLIILDRGSKTRELHEHYFESSGSPMNIRMELGSIEVIKEMVKLDLGVSIVPDFAVAKEVAQRELHTLKITGLATRRKLGVVHRKNDLPHSARAFMDLIG